MNTREFIRPPEQSSACLEKDVMVRMRDGIHLATDVYFPGVNGRRAGEKFPVILERTPYGKSVLSRSEKPDSSQEPLTRAEVARFFTSQGYVVIYQDCRGRHGSEGKFIKYLSDADDGYDTCAWIVAQDWCDGNIGTKGLSYAAHTQMALASAGAPGLKAMCVDSGGFSNGYSNGIRQGGAYELKQAAWAVIFAAQNARLAGSDELQISPEELDNWFKRMPWRRGDSPLTASPEYEDFLFDQWEKGVFDDYWKQPGIYAQGFYPLMKDVAALHISSWYDVYPRTAAENFVGMAGGNAPARLILGPWTHGNRWETFSGDVDFGKSAGFEANVAPGFLEMRLKWFDRWLKKLDNGAEYGAPVLIFVMGGGSGKKNRDGRLDHGGKWRAERTWPLPHAIPTTFFFHHGGRLRNEMPAEELAFKEYVFNPLYPVPTLGGAVVSRPPAILAGAYNQVESAEFFGCEAPFGPLSERQDVLVFESEPLAADVEFTGAIQFVLWVSSDCVDTDFTAKLVDVYPPSADYPEGYAMNLTDGILRTRYRDSWEKPELMTPGEIYKICIEAFPTSNLFKRGHRIRVDISSSNFPHFDVNPNTGAAEAQSEDLLIASNRIYCDAEHPSHVILPFVSLDVHHV